LNDAPEPDRLVVDASAAIEIVLDTEAGARALGHMRGRRSLHAPAHLDAEVLSALGRLCRAGKIDPRDAARALADLAEAPIERHPLAELLLGAWERRDSYRLMDALYVELADAVASAAILTADERLARAGAPALLI
jgi:predicted nucleic acid-binding protein